MSDQWDADDHSVGGQHSKISQANQIYHIASEQQFLSTYRTCTEFKSVTDNVVMNLMILIYIYFMINPVFAIYYYSL